VLWPREAVGNKLIVSTGFRKDRWAGRAVSIKGGRRE